MRECVGEGGRGGGGLLTGPIGATGVWCVGDGVWCLGGRESESEVTDQALVERDLDRTVRLDCARLT